LWGAGESLRISPSSVEKIEKCPLKWAFEAAGVDKGSLNQGVGTLIHEIAAALPSGSYSMLRAELERRWPQLSLKPGWLELQQRSKAEAMLRRLANYYSDLPNSTTAYSEVEFRLETESAVVAGRVDRIECLADGKYRIVDFKTGSTVPSPADAENNEQLRIYQLALNSAAFPALPNHAQSEGGQLLYLGKGTKDELPSVRVSSTLTPQRTEETQKLLVETANVMAAAEFAAKSNTLCLSCTLKFACPLQAAGKQVIS
jgi:RecB family exonuclease